MSAVNEEILNFVNSKDIRKHLQNIGYQFNALEAAWLIWQSRNSTLEEKHNAWKQVIAEYPDIPVFERMNTLPQPSLHRFLEEYMDMENRTLERFRDSSGAVYQLEYHTPGYDPVRETRMLSEFDPGRMNFALGEEDDITNVRCIRLPVDAPNEKALHTCFSVHLDMQKRIMGVDPDPGLLSERDKELEMDIFPGFWFDFPTPFLKGDILWDPQRPDGFCRGPFACTSINHHGIADEKQFEYMRREADTSDMTAHGLFVSAEHSVYGECMSNYMNCEYYPKELIGFQRLLTPFSAYEKSKIDAELLVHACHYITLETEKDYTGMGWYTAETLKKVGIVL